jgi:hypothetical protein
LDAGYLDNDVESSFTSSKNPFQTPSSSGILRFAFIKLPVGLGCRWVDDWDVSILEGADSIGRLMGAATGNDRFKLGGRAGRRGGVWERDAVRCCTESTSSDTDESAGH